MGSGTSEHRRSFYDDKLPSWRSLTKESVDFYFSQAEKELINTKEIFVGYTNKMHQTLGFTFTLSSIILTILVKINGTGNVLVATGKIVGFDILQVLMIAIGLMNVFAVLLLWVSLLQENKLKNQGNHPKFILFERKLLAAINSGEQYNFTVLEEISSYAQRINYNNRLNKRKKKFLVFMRYITGVTFFLIIITILYYYLYS